jgi:hypothetical protein
MCFFLRCLCCDQIAFTSCEKCKEVCRKQPANTHWINKCRDCIRAKCIGLTCWIKMYVFNYSITRKDLLTFLMFSHDIIWCTFLIAYIGEMCYFLRCTICEKITFRWCKDFVACAKILSIPVHVQIWGDCECYPRSWNVKTVQIECARTLTIIVSNVN